MKMDPEQAERIFVACDQVGLCTGSPGCLVHFYIAISVYKNGHDFLVILCHKKGHGHVCDNNSSTLGQYIFL